MHTISRAILTLGLAAGLCAAASAQPVKPDPSHLPFVPPENIKWSGTAASPMQSATLFGDPDKAGPYAILVKWNPGNFSKPHFHTTDRWAYVISGTWWVSTCSRRPTSAPAAPRPTHCLAWTLKRLPGVTARSVALPIWPRW